MYMPQYNTVMVTVKKRSRWTMPIVAVVFLFVTILQLFSPAITYAKTVDDIHDINYKYYASRYLRDCLAGLDSRLKNSIPLAALNENTWLTGGDHKVITGYIFEPTDGLAGCEETGLVKTAMMSLGYENDPGKLLTDIGYTKQGANFIRPASGDTMNVTIVDKLQQPNYARYVYYQKLFVDNCKLVEPPAGNGEDVTVNKAVLGDDGNWSVKPVTMRWQDASVHGTVNNPDYRVSSVTCDNLLKSLSDVLVNSVVAYNNAHKDDPITDKAAGETDNCNKDTPGWNAETKTCDEEKKTKITCAIEGIGWFICPTLTFMARISDQAYGFLASTFLQVEPGMLDNAKDAWARFRDVANILFVIAFLIVVFSQLTSIGISNYGIKKMLPRIVVAAVLVNVSFLICQIAVDLSNILGYGVASFVDTAFKLTSPSDAATEAGVGFATATATVLTGVALVALALSIPVLLSALLAIGLMVLILIGRKVIILLLVVVSPIAFVAYLLPNTEQWFKKWYKTFSTMLLLFPIVALVFAISKLAMAVLAESAKDNPALQWAALGAGVVPFFAVPPLLKTSLNSIGKMGEKFSGMMDKRLNKVKSNINDNSLAGAYKKQWDRDQQIKNNQVIAGTYTGGNYIRKGLSGVSGVINRSRLTGSLGDKITAAGASAALSLKSEDVENEMKSMQAAWGPGQELTMAKDAYEAALKSNDVTKARAAQKILLSKGGAGVKAIRQTIQKGDFKAGSTAVEAARSDLSAAGLKSKDAGLNAWSYDSKNRDLATLDGEAGTYSALTESELSTQSHGSMIRAVNSGGVSGARAKNILDNATLDANLTEDTRDALRRAHQGVAQKRDPDAP